MATPVIYIAELQDEDSLFSLGEICERCGVPADIVVEMVEYGIVRPAAAIAARPLVLLTCHPGGARDQELLRDPGTLRLRRARAAAEGAESTRHRAPAADHRSGHGRHRHRGARAGAVAGRRRDVQRPAGQPERGQRRRGGGRVSRRLARRPGCAGGRLGDRLRQGCRRDGDTPGGVARLRHHEGDQARGSRDHAGRSADRRGPDLGGHRFRSVDDRGTERGAGRKDSADQQQPAAQGHAGRPGAHALAAARADRGHRHGRAVALPRSLLLQQPARSATADAVRRRSRWTASRASSRTYAPRTTSRRTARPAGR